MDSIDLKQYLDSTGIPYKAHGKEYALQYCPYCERTGEGDFSHFYFSQERQTFFCHKCGVKGNLYRFMLDRGDIAPITKARELQYKRPRENRDFTSRTDEFYSWFHKTRGIDPTILAKYQVGYQRKNGKYTIVYQYYDQCRVLFNRKYYIPEPGENKKPPRWTEKDAEHGFYGLQFIDYRKPYLHICAGEDDCHALVQMGFDNVVSVPYGDRNYSPAMDKVVQQFPELTLLFDNDPSGQEGARNFAEKAGLAKCKNVILPFKDARDCLLQGLTVVDIQAKIAIGEAFKHEEIIKPEDIRTDFMKFIKDGEKLLGRSIRIPGFNKIVGGIRLSELSVLTGYTGRGKSTFAYNFIRWAEEVGFRCLIMSFENRLFSVISKLIEIYTGERLRVYDEAGKKYRLCQSMPWIEAEYDRLNRRNIYFLNKAKAKDGYYDLERMGQVIEYAVKFHDVNVFVIDHLHYFLKISDARNPVSKIDEAVRLIKQWAERYNIHVLLIVHPHMTQDNKQGNPPKLGLNCVKGASSISQESDNFWVISRKEEENGSNLSRLEVLKNREMGREGIITLQVLDNLNTYAVYKPTEEGKAND